MSGNHILSTLSESDAALMRPHIEAVDLPVRRILEKPNKAIEHIYFLDNGLASIVTTNGEDNIEAGIIGSEGMTGMSVVMDNDRSPHSTFMQMAGSGQRMKADALREAMQQSPSLRLFLLHFAQAFMVQSSYSVLTNGWATIDQRLARWLLMAHDRQETDELILTHEFMGIMLGVRRAGVTVALHQLEDNALIRTGRSRVVILDRKGLKALAGGIYGIPEAEYQRLIGWSPLH